MQKQSVLDMVSYRFKLLPNLERNILLVTISSIGFLHCYCI